MNVTDYLILAPVMAMLLGGVLGFLAGRSSR